MVVMQSLRIIAIGAIFAAVLVAGCGSLKSSQSTPHGKSNYLSQAEIEAVGAGNLYDVVNRLRPRWLSVRGAGRSFGMNTSILVYQGSVLMGNSEVLKQISPRGVYSLEFVDGATASATLPGAMANHTVGAIVITLMTQVP